MILPSVSLQVVTALDAVSLGVMLVIVSLGLTLVYGFMNVINFAHGAFWMLGGYLAIATVNRTGSFLLAFGVIAIVVGIMAVIMEIGLLRPTYDESMLTQLLVTIGVFYVIQGAILLTWGELSQSLVASDILSGSISLFGIQYSIYRVFVIFTGLTIILGTWAFLQYTSIGLIVRASLLDKEMARGLGHNIPRIYLLVFTGAVISAAIAGMLMTPIRGMSPGSGLIILLESFAIVLIGGLGSFRGTVVAGMTVGIADTIITRYIAFSLGGYTIFAILLVILMIRPIGLFGVEEAASH